MECEEGGTKGGGLSAEGGENKGENVIGLVALWTRK